MSVALSLQAPAGASPVVTFALATLRDALRQAGYRLDQGPADLTPRLARRGFDPLSGDEESSLPRAPESYALRHDEHGLALLGSDERGLLYACLDVAEQLDLGRDLDHLALRTRQPELRVRGLYTFLHNAEAERGWLYDPSYWRDYAEMLARCRFNRFNLVYGHQTAHLIPIYAFLLDGLERDFPEIRVERIGAEERARNLAALQTASQAMADHGLTFILGIWQSRPWRTEHGVWETQPSRVSGTDDLGLLAEYTRVGFLRLMEACPAIGGIQLRMNIESGVGDQRFFVRAFVPALRELVANGRRLTVELRNWGLQPETLQAFQDAGVEVVVSTKYFAEHQAMPYQPPAMRGSYSYDSLLRRDKPYPLQWHVWNLGSHRLFNWGDPDYARRLALSCHLGDGIGFEVTPPGSQKGFSQWGQVSPGDWHARTDLPPRPDFQRYWFFHLAFGRMGYDPATEEAVFLRQLARRTRDEAAAPLLAAYRAASQVVSYLISHHMDDPNMYVWPELDSGGLIDHHLVAPPGEETLFAAPQEHAAATIQGLASAKRSPFQAADDLEGIADEIERRLHEVSTLPHLENNLEWRTVRVDFAALAHLARYHAAKARAAGHLALFYACGERCHLDAAESEATDGVRRWERLEANTEVYYRDLHLGPSGGHWHDNCRRVGYDLKRIARVRELWEAYGLFVAGFDFGPAVDERLAPRFRSGLEWEPRFVCVGPLDAYDTARGWGWRRAVGIRSVGPAPLPRDRIWGVHYIKPCAPPDPGEVDMVPTEALTQRYLAGDVRSAFCVALPNGAYAVTLIPPEVSGTVTPAFVNGELAMLGAPGGQAATVEVQVGNGLLEVALGGAGPWALAGMVVRALRPQIAHLPPRAIRAEHNLTLTATATSPRGPCRLWMRYTQGGQMREVPFAGDGVAFSLAVPVSDLCGESWEYWLRAEDAAGQVSECGPFHTSIVRGYRPPRVVSVRTAAVWAHGRPWEVEIDLADGEWCESLRLHYREADQNRPFRQVAQSAGRSGLFRFAVDTRYLDAGYDLIYYVECLDLLGGGSFWPDPFRDARYRVCPPA